LDTHQKAMVSVSINEQGKHFYNRQIGLERQDLGVFSDTLIKSDVDTKYYIGSITKVFTATLVFDLIEKNKLTLSTKLSAFFPNVANAQTITIEQMLSHRSGIFNNTNDARYWGYMNDKQTQEQMVNRIADYTSVFEPGSKYEYSNSNYLLLGYIIEKITAETYQQYLQTQIIGKLALKNTLLDSETNKKEHQASSFNYSYERWNENKNAHPSIAFSAGAMLSTTKDLTIFIRALFNGELISKDSLAIMKGDNDDIPKGLFNWLDRGITYYGHGGLYNQFQSTLAYNPVDDVAMAISTNARKIPLNEIAGAVLDIQGDFDFELPVYLTAPIELEASELEKYKGVFSSKDLHLDITYLVKFGKLYTQATGQDALKMVPLSKQTFEFSPAGIIYEFDVNADGTTDYDSFTLIQGGGIYYYTRITEEAPKPVELEASLLKNYEGIYSSNGLDLNLTIFAKGNKLYGQATNQSSFLITPFSDNKFEFKEWGITLIFDKNEDGSPNYDHFTQYQGWGTYYYSRIVEESEG
ncbi:MAG: beta-lactamase family protein, partial [Psychromonas sp.]|nr:beta-lactamase family protein [Psychromonas sp.]